MTYSRDQFKPGDKVRCTIILEGTVEETPYMKDIIGLRVGTGSGYGRYRSVKLAEVTDVEWQVPEPYGWPPREGDAWRVTKDSGTRVTMFCFRREDGLLYWTSPIGRQMKVASTWESRSSSTRDWIWELGYREGTRDQIR